LTARNYKKCIGLIEGNHEKAIRRKGHVDIHSNICGEIGVPDLGYTAFVRLIFLRDGANAFEVQCVFTHGRTGGRTKGGKINSLNRFMLRFDADVYARGHSHDLIVDTVPYLGLTRGGKILHKVKSGAITGCYFSTYTQGVSSSYGEEAEFDPTSLGCAVFHIKPMERRVEVHRELVI